MVLPRYELERLEALRRSNILDTSPEGDFDELTFLASQICQTPISLIVMADEKRYWFKSKLGLAVNEVGSDSHLGAHTILQSELLNVRDTAKNQRLSDNALLKVDPKIRFYAGTPLVTPDGFVIGTLCVMDSVPRTLNKNQRRALSILGDQGSRLIALRHKNNADLEGSSYPEWTRLLPSRDASTAHLLPELAANASAVPITKPQRSEARSENAHRNSVAANIGVSDRDALLKRLGTALAHNELTIHFQPKIELGSKRVTGFEALVRWLHPSLGFVLPEEFIPLAEDSGQIASLTPWVLEHSLKRAHHAGWPARGLQVAVNLSARNLQEEDLPEQIQGILKSWDFPPGFLTLEITESAVMSDFSGALSILNRLREIGVFLSLDDFGTGHSSLAYLKELPLQEMKIDRALVSNVHRYERDFAIVKFTVELGHNLGMSVVGEGVEEAATLQALNDMGCDGAQGYAIGKPMRPDEIATWLSAH